MESGDSDSEDDDDDDDGDDDDDDDDDDDSDYESSEEGSSDEENGVGNQFKCAYCNISNSSALAKCVATGKWFCTSSGTRSASCVVMHLVPQAQAIAPTDNPWEIPPPMHKRGEKIASC